VRLASSSTVLGWLAAAAVLCGGGPATASPRVFSLDQCADQYVLALSPRPAIAGLSMRARNADSDLRAMALGLPLRRATTESVLAAQPQIVVREWGGDARLVAALRRRHIRVVQLGDATDFAGVAANIRKLAAALGQAPAGEALIGRMQRKLAAAKGAWAGAGALYLTPGGETAGRGTLVGAILAAAGLADLAPHAGYASLSLERLIADPPSAMVLGFFRDLAAGNQHWTLAGNGRFRAIAKRRSIASLPGKLVGCPTWFAADAAVELAQARR